MNILGFLISSSEPERDMGLAVDEDFLKWCVNIGRATYDTETDTYTLTLPPLPSELGIDLWDDDY
jgi:hypothetical protein